MSVNVLKGRLSNVQLELMKLFTTDVSDEELKEVKRMLLEFKFNRVTALADQLWEEKSWTNKDMDKLLKTHRRTPYKAQERENKKRNKKS